MRRSKKDSAITRETLLAAAMDVLTKTSYKAARLDDIAKAAGVLAIPVPLIVAKAAGVLAIPVPLIVAEAIGVPTVLVPWISGACWRPCPPCSLSITIAQGQPLDTGSAAEQFA